MLKTLPHIELVYGPHLSLYKYSTFTLFHVQIPEQLLVFLPLCGGRHNDVSVLK